MNRTDNITCRAVILGILSVPLNIYLVVQTETVWTTQYPTTMTIIFNAVATLFVTDFKMPYDGIVKSAKFCTTSFDGRPMGDDSNAFQLLVLEEQNVEAVNSEQPNDTDDTPEFQNPSNT